MKVALLGATSKTGRYVVTALCAHGHHVIAVGRDPARLATLDPRAEQRRADIADETVLRAALAGADCVASLAHARHTAAVLAAAPPASRLVLTGSVRKFTRLPDPAADAVREGEAQFLASGRPGVMLHPSMIYGAPEERNVNRLLAFLSRFPRGLPIPVPLPDGGRHTVQPVFVDDMVAAVVAAIETPSADGPSIIVAGPEPIAYREMVRTCAQALGRRVVIVTVPVSILSRIAAFLGKIGVKMPFDAAELARGSESKSFDIKGLVQTLGIRPRSFAAGLKARLERQ